METLPNGQSICPGSNWPSKQLKWTAVLLRNRDGQTRETETSAPGRECTHPEGEPITNRSLPNETREQTGEHRVSIMEGTELTRFRDESQLVSTAWC